jgi:hypothetical protein
MIRTCLPLAALALLAGCSGENKDTAPATDAPKQVEAAPALPGAPPKASAAIAVDGEGLRILLGAGESARAIPFGADETTVVTAIAKLRGKPSQSKNEECPAGSINFAMFGGLHLLFQDGKFGGWSLSSAEAGGIGTVNGIAIGSTRAALNNAFPANKIDPESTLGTEFYTGGNAEGGISGLLDGTGPNAKITNLWSGLSCNFR